MGANPALPDGEEQLVVRASNVAASSKKALRFIVEEGRSMASESREIEEGLLKILFIWQQKNERMSALGQKS